jgi:hypothetical protein
VEEIISREYMEEFYPDFVKRVALLVKEADDFNRDICPVPEYARKRVPGKSPYNGGAGKRGTPLQDAITALLRLHGDLRPAEVARMISRGNYQSVRNTMQKMVDEKKLVRKSLGVYTLP